MSAAVKTAVLGLLLAFICLSAAEAAEIGQVVLVLWHGLEWSQIKDFDCGIAAAWGLMNTRWGGGDALSGCYLSLGAGARAAGCERAGVFLEKERGKGAYQLNTGKAPAEIINPYIAQIQRAQNLNYTVVAGALGSALWTAEIPVRALGNSDGAEKARWAALAAMDSLGRVRAGTITEEILLNDPSYPFGLRTDYELLQKKAAEASEPLLVIDLGDPFRFDQYSSFLTEEQREVLQERMIGEAKAFLKELALQKDPQTLIVLVSPHPGAQRAEQGYWLTPLLCLGAGGGLLSSATTRWAGLVTNMDLAPSVLESLGAGQEDSFIGRAFTVQAHPDPVGSVDELMLRLLRLTERRGAVLKGGIAAQVLLFGSALILIISGRGLPARLLRISQYLLILFLSMPLLAVLWPALSWAVFLLPLALSVFHWKRREILAEAGLLAILTALVIIADVCTGSSLLRFSYLGYDPVGGARFYGLGNEMMGILVGSAVLGWSIIRQRQGAMPYPVGIGVLVLGAALAVIAAPSLGTNVGGAICAVFAFGFTLFPLRSEGGLANLRRICLMLLAAGAVLGILMLIDGANPSHLQSHIGRTVSLFRTGGWFTIGQIIVRKLAMNLKLLRYSAWSKALFTAVAVMGASFIWPSAFISWLKKNYPFIAQGIKGTAAGALAAFLFNDSGVVAAATCLYFASATLLLLALELKHDLNTPQAHI